MGTKKVFKESVINCASDEECCDHDTLEIKILHLLFWGVICKYTGFHYFERGRFSQNDR